MEYRKIAKKIIIMLVHLAYDTLLFLEATKSNIEVLQ
jgi:hypothetical protein